jgi:hypothetical protein
MPRWGGFRMLLLRRLRPAVVALAATGIVVASASADAPVPGPLPGEPPIPRRPAPALQCGKTPFDSQCPQVQGVFTVKAPSGATSVAFGPGSPATYQAPPARAARQAHPAVRHRKVRAKAAQFEIICTFDAHVPEIGLSNGNRYAWASAHLVCSSQPGYVLTYSELGSTLQRYISGSWQNLDSDFDSVFGSSSALVTYVSYDCHHEGTYTYKNDSYAYVVINSYGYYAALAPSANHTCWP